MSVLNAIAIPRFVSGWKGLNVSCSNRACRPSSVLHNLSWRRNGIQVGDQWNCSADCFEETARGRLAELCRRGTTTPPVRRFRVPLGLILLSRSCINNDQLQYALKMQRRDGRRIGELLVSLGYVTEREVTAAVAAQSGYPVFSMENRIAENRVPLPLSLLELHSILPVHFSPTTRRLMIGFVDRVDNILLRAIEQMTATITVPCFITPTDFKQQMGWLASACGTEGIRFERLTSPLEMARIVRSYAVQVSADEASFGRLSDYVWSRVSGHPQEIDLFFKMPATEIHLP